MTDLAIQEIARAMCIAYNQVLLNQPDDERNQPLAMEAAYTVARKHIEADVVTWLREQADKGAEWGIASEKGSTRRAAFGGGSLAVDRAADAIERGDYFPALQEEQS